MSSTINVITPNESTSIVSGQGKSPDQIGKDLATLSYKGKVIGRIRAANSAQGNRAVSFDLVKLDTGVGCDMIATKLLNEWLSKNCDIPSNGYPTFEIGTDENHKLILGKTVNDKYHEYRLKWKKNRFYFNMEEKVIKPQQAVVPSIPVVKKPIVTLDGIVGSFVNKQLDEIKKKELERLQKEAEAKQLEIQRKEEARWTKALQVPKFEILEKVILPKAIEIYGNECQPLTDLVLTYSGHDPATGKEFTDTSSRSAAVDRRFKTINCWHKFRDADKESMKVLGKIDW